MTASRGLSDPLLRFTQELEGGSASRFSETVDVAPLFSAQAALASTEAASPLASYHARLGSAQALTDVADVAGWTPLTPSDYFRSGIVLLRAHDQSTNEGRPGTDTPPVPRRASPYTTSAPSRELRADELEVFCRALGPWRGSQRTWRPRHWKRPNPGGLVRAAVT